MGLFSWNINSGIPREQWEKIHPVISGAKTTEEVKVELFGPKGNYTPVRRRGFSDSNDKFFGFLGRLTFVSLIFKVIAVVLLIASIIFVVTFIAFGDQTDTYEKLGSKGANSFDKKLAFVSNIVFLTGKTDYAVSLGFTEEEADAMLGANAYSTGFFNTVTGEPDNLPTATPPSYGQYSDEDLRPLAQAVADAMLSEDGMASGPAKSGHDIYCVSVGNSYDVTYENNTQSIKFRCCTTMVMGIEKLLGNTDFLTHVGNSYTCSTWIANTNNASQRFSTVGLTCADLQVGDILLKDGHTEIVVFIDDNNVYIANGGNDGDGIAPDPKTTGIKICSSQGDHPGYSYAKSKTSDIGFTYILRY